MFTLQIVYKHQHCSPSTNANTASADKFAEVSEKFCSTQSDWAVQIPITHLKTECGCFPIHLAVARTLSTQKTFAREHFAPPLLIYYNPLRENKYLSAFALA